MGFSDIIPEWGGEFLKNTAKTAADLGVNTLEGLGSGVAHGVKLVQDAGALGIDGITNGASAVHNMYTGTEGKDAWHGTNLRNYQTGLDKAVKNMDEAIANTDLIESPLDDSEIGRNVQKGYQVLGEFLSPAGVTKIGKLFAEGKKALDVKKIQSLLHLKGATQEQIKQGAKEIKQLEKHIKDMIKVKGQRLIEEGKKLKKLKSKKPTHETSQQAAKHADNMQKLQREREVLKGEQQLNKPKVNAIKTKMEQGVDKAKKINKKINKIKKNKYTIRNGKVVKNRVNPKVKALADRANRIKGISVAGVSEFNKNKNDKTNDINIKDPGNQNRDSKPNKRLHLNGDRPLGVMDIDGELVKVYYDNANQKVFTKGQGSETVDLAQGLSPEEAQDYLSSDNYNEWISKYKDYFNR